MRPNLKDVISLVKNADKGTVYFSMDGWQFSVTTFPVPNCVTVIVGSDLRKSVKKGLDALEAQETESRKSSNRFARLGNNDNSEGNRADSD